MNLQHATCGVPLIGLCIRTYHAEPAFAGCYCADGNHPHAVTNHIQVHRRALDNAKM